LIRPLISTALLAGCFDPRLAPVSCETTGRCPAGLICVDDACVEGPSGEVCGDGVIGGGERCDDGNTTGGDGCSADCREVRCTAPITHPGVQAAIDDPACATVYLSPGRYVESLVIDRDVVVAGAGFGDIAVDGGGAARVIEILPGRSVTLRDFAVQSGLAVAGGGVRNDGDLVLERMRISGNVARGGEAAGGGIWHRLGSLRIRSSTIAGNRVEASGAAAAAGRGGAIFAEAPLAIEASVIAGNRVEVVGIDSVARGGAIEVRAAEARLDDCEVAGNTAEAIAAPGATSTSAGGGAISGIEAASIAVAGGALAGNAARVSGPGDALSGAGGAIAVIGGEVALSAGVELYDNRVTLSGAAPEIRGQGGAVYASAAELAVDAAAIRGGRLETFGSGGAPVLEGGGLWCGDGADCALTGSRITGAAGGAGAALAGAGSLVLRRVSIDSNGGAGVSVALGPGAVDVAVVNSTVAANAGPGIEVIDRGGAAGAVRLLSATVAGNAGGLVSEAAGVELRLESAIVAANQGADCPAALSLEGDYNLAGPGCAFAGDPQSNLIGVDPRLGPLADHGGGAPTVALDAASPAIDAGALPFCAGVDGAPLETDQRGLPRAAGSRCDIGAFERQVLPRRSEQSPRSRTTMIP
jgi:cysteine-rich repeat protein